MRIDDRLRQAAAAVARHFESVQAPPLKQGRPRFRPVSIQLALSILVIVGLTTAALYLANAADEGPTVSTGAEFPTSTTETTMLPPQPTPSWVRVNGLPLIGGTMTSIVAHGAGYIAGGYVDANGDRDAAIWVAANGGEWVRATDGSSRFGGQGEQVINSVVTWRGGVIAVGHDASGGSVNAAVWVSDDGQTWQRAEGPESTQQEILQDMVAVAAGGPGLVAVGSILASDGRNLQAGVWTSADGFRWERQELGVDAMGSTGSALGMVDVTPWRQGLVAVGTETNSGQSRGAVWHSANGIVWSRVQADTMPVGSVIAAVTTRGDHLIAAGSIRRTPTGTDEVRAAVWISTDGIEWRSVLVPDGEQQVSQRITDIANTPLGLFAVGNEMTPDYWVGAMWYSMDESTWQRVPEVGNHAPGFGGQTLHAIAAGNDGVVAVGHEFGSNSGADTAAVWYLRGD